MRRALITMAACLALAMAAAAADDAAPPAKGPYARWRNGPPDDPSFFPIGVWLQEPSRAKEYKDAGFSLYVGLPDGPTEAQLAVLDAVGMKVICRQNEVGLKHRRDRTIVGWMHDDEPDNAQPLEKGKGYGPPVPPENVIAELRKMRKADGTRPVLLNLGQGVAWDQWHGRGVRTNHPEDYPQYLRGCDIVSFDIYPVVHDKPAVAGKLWYVARGVERLVKWSRGRRPVWTCIECTRVHSRGEKPTPQQVRCEVWMAIVHGATGIIYFVHEWQPHFNDAALLKDAEMLAAVKRINRRITELAPVLNSPTVEGEAGVAPENDKAPIALMMKRHAGSVYLFAVAMRGAATGAHFAIRGAADDSTVTVLGEGRTLAVKDGGFDDRFAPWDVHLYRINAPDAK